MKKCIIVILLINIFKTWHNIKCFDYEIKLYSSNKFFFQYSYSVECLENDVSIINFKFLAIHWISFNLHSSIRSIHQKAKMGIAIKNAYQLESACKFVHNREQQSAFEKFTLLYVRTLLLSSVASKRSLCEK